MQTSEKTELIEYIEEPREEEESDGKIIFFKFYHWIEYNEVVVRGFDSHLEKLII